MRRTNDQWFEPGDKVMRESLHGFNVVLLVGAPVVYNQLGLRKGFVASNFRKVEEVKLCVAAVNRVKVPERGEEKSGAAQRVPTMGGGV